MSINSLKAFQEACAKPESFDDLELDAIPVADLRAIDWEALGAFTNVKSLELSELHIIELPASLAKLTKLKRVTIKQTPKLDWDQAFGRLAEIPNLDALEVKLQSKLVTIPESIGKLSKLTWLYLYQIGAKTLPAGLFQLTSLNRLYLYFMSVPTVPDDLGNLTGLQELTLCSIDLKELTPAVGKLDKVERLSLQGNKLKALPETIGGMARLADLDLSRNAIKDLPKSFAGLQKLESLDYSSNKLKKLPAPICELSALTKMFLSANDLKELPEQLGELPLKKLYVRGNANLQPDAVPANLRAIADFT